MNRRLIFIGLLIILGFTFAVTPCVMAESKLKTIYIYFPNPVDGTIDSTLDRRSFFNRFNMGKGVKCLRLDDLNDIEGIEQAVNLCTSKKGMEMPFDVYNTALRAKISETDSIEWYSLVEPVRIAIALQGTAPTAREATELIWISDDYVYRGKQRYEIDSILGERVNRLVTPFVEQ